MFLFPDCGTDRGLKAAELEANAESSFEKFVQRATNIPNIWVKIMTNLKGEDVANCLKVCKGLRFAINECMVSNSKFKNQLDAAATVIALQRGRLLSSSIEFNFSDGRDSNLLCALDGTWYHHKHFFHYDHLVDYSSSSQTSATKDMSTTVRRNIKIATQHSSVVIHSSPDPSVALVQKDQIIQPLKLSSNPAELVERVDPNASPGPPKKKKKVEGTNIEHDTGRSRCILYRILIEDKSEVTMNLLSSHATEERSTLLSKNVRGHIMHASSNEQVKL